MAIKKNKFESLEDRKLLAADVVFQFDNPVDNAALVRDYDGDGKDELVVLHGVPSVYDQNGLKFAGTDDYLEWTVISEANDRIFLLETEGNSFTFGFSVESNELVGLPAIGGALPRQDSYDFNGDGSEDFVSFNGNTVSVTLGVTENPTEPEDTD